MHEIMVCVYCCLMESFTNLIEISTSFLSHTFLKKYPR